MGMVGSYLRGLMYGIIWPCTTDASIFVGAFPWHAEAGKLGLRHGCWVGRWLHGKPTRAMIYKMFVLVAGILIGWGYVCIDTYYRPLTGIAIGTAGVLMFFLWGINNDDLKDEAGDDHRNS